MTTKMVMMRADITLKIEVEICRKYQTDEQIDEWLIEIANAMGCSYLYLEESND